MNSRFVKKIIAGSILAAAFATSLGMSTASASDTAYTIYKEPINKVVAAPEATHHCKFEIQYGNFGTTAYAEIRVSSIAKGYVCEGQVQDIAIVKNGVVSTDNSHYAYTFNSNWAQITSKNATGFGADFYLAEYSSTGGNTYNPVPRAEKWFSVSAF